MNCDELERICKEAVVSKRGASRNFHEGAEEETYKDAPCLVCRDSNLVPSEYKSNPLGQWFPTCGYAYPWGYANVILVLAENTKVHL
jgi:hypothetical protein